MRRVDGGLEQSILPLLSVRFTGGLDKVLGGEGTTLKIWGVRGRGGDSLRGHPDTECNTDTSNNKTSSISSQQYPIR